MRAPKGSKGRLKDKRRKPRYCPDCYTEMGKAGKTKYGKQKWSCYQCGYNTVHPLMTCPEDIC